MLGRRLASLSSLLNKKPSFSRSRPLQNSQSRRFLCTSSDQAGSAGGGKKSLLRRRAVPILLLSLTGGFALSALNDLAIFHGCSSKAIEFAGRNHKIIEALGEPIVRGPWYDASLAVSYRRQSVSCTFPVSGPQGSGIFQLKAIRHGENTWFSFLRHNDWDILVMEALLHVPSNDEKHQTIRVSLMDSAPPSATIANCHIPEAETPKK